MSEQDVDTWPCDQVDRNGIVNGLILVVNAEQRLEFPRNSH